MTMNKLESIDRAFVLFVNGLHSPFLDDFMWFVSGKLSLFPIYLLLLFLLKRTYSWKLLGIILLGLAVSIFISDQISVHLFKNIVARYRPSHNEHLKHLLHFYEVKPGEFYTGGKYGFVSSHASNFFTMIAFIFPFFKNNKILILSTLVVVGLIIALSRIYLGVHYLSDVIVGATLGILVGYFTRKTLLIILKKQQISI